MKGLTCLLENCHYLQSLADVRCHKTHKSLDAVEVGPPVRIVKPDVVQFLYFSWITKNMAEGVGHSVDFLLVPELHNTVLVDLYSSMLKYFHFFVFRTCLTVEFFGLLYIQRELPIHEDLIDTSLVMSLHIVAVNAVVHNLSILIQECLIGQILEQLV